jgi:hypothetical protein
LYGDRSTQYLKRTLAWNPVETSERLMLTHAVDLTPTDIQGLAGRNTTRLPGTLEWQDRAGVAAMSSAFKALRTRYVEAQEVLIRPPLQQLFVPQEPERSAEEAEAEGAAAAGGALADTQNQVSKLAPGVVLRGSLLSEPVEVIAIVPMGSGFALAATPPPRPPLGPLPGHSADHRLVSW